MISLALPDFANSVLGDDQARDVGDGGEQVHLLVLAGLGELAFLAVHGGGAAGGHVPGIRQHGRIQPGMQRVRAEPAVPSLLPEALPGRRLPLPLLPVLIPGALLFRAVRGVRGRDRGIERGLRDARGQRGLEPVGIDHLRQPAQRRCRRRDPQPGPRGHPAAVHGQHVLIPPRRGLRDRQRPAEPGRRPCHRHRDQRRQLVPDPVQPPQVRQPPGQRLPEPHRIRGRPGREVAADALDKP